MNSNQLSSLQKQIYEVLLKTDDLKASEIAKMINVERKMVNSALYTKPLFDMCIQDKTTFRWSLKKKNSEIKEHKDNEVVADEKLVNLCKYYLNCIDIEGGTSVSVFQKSNFDLNYREIKNLSLDGEDNEISQFVRKISSDKNKVAYLGYPLLFSTIHSVKTNLDYQIICPVFLFSVEYNSGNIQIAEYPLLNNKVISRYSDSEVSSAMYEAINLENELGFGGNEIPEMDELILHLKAIRPNWEWMEEMDPDCLSCDIPAKEIEREGIYNKAIVLATDRPTFTLGLESELTQLSKIEEKTYQHSALYKLLHHKFTIGEIKDEKQILEVLPLNTEQKDAIQSALQEDVTVITGPPGTGKSQVVTDLLINMAVSGKSVLFASKNNKAVDVVNTRVNELGKKPIMLRFTSTPAPLEFAQMIENLLSANNNVPEEEFKTCLKDYNAMVANYKGLESKKSEFVNLRNELDKIEQKYCLIRSQCAELFEIADSIDTSKIDRHLQIQNQSFINACKEKQDFFTRLFWFAVSKQRLERYAYETKGINDILASYKIYRNDSMSDGEQQSFVNKVREFINNISLMNEYKDNLERLTELQSLEEIDHEIMELSENMREKAMEFWNLWLMSRTFKFSSKQISEMNDYIIAAKLMADSHSMDVSDGKVAMKFKKMQSDLANYFPCWAVTSLSAKGRIPLTAGMFDLLVIDEASQCDIASIIPLLYRAKRVVVIGDKKQLSHISTLTKQQDIMMLDKYDVDLKWSYSSNSFFGLVSSMAPKNVISLRDHHRSHADIISFSNEEFYDNSLRIATDYRRFKVPNNQTAGIHWIDVVGKTERPRSGSAINKHEVDAIIAELRRLVIENDYAGTIGVVSPFRAQADRIREEVEKDKELKNALLKNDFLVDTVHKFQGDEKDVMIFSPVISKGANQGAVGFLNSTGNLFNVAITRARSVLIVVGDQNYCRSCGISYMENFVSYVDTLGKKQMNERQLYDYGSTYPINVDDSVVSEWEKVFYEELYRHRIVTTPQYPEDKYKLDLALFIKESKLDIEIDGEMYHKDWNGELCYRDKLRNQRLFELGWDVKRFWVYQIRDELPSCIDQIAEWISQHE